MTRQACVGADDLTETAATIQSDALVCDMCVPWHEEFLPDRADIDAVLDRFSASGVNYVSLTAAAVEDPAAAMIQLAKRRREILARPDRYVFVYRADDIRLARREGKLAIGLHFQGTHPIGRNLDFVELYHRLGIRSMLLVYNEKTFVGDGCHEPSDGPLSVFGKLVVQELNRLGILVDCSHTGERTSLEAMEMSSAPVIFSHSGPRAIFDHPRNITDEQAIACARTGGVVGVNGVGMFLGADASQIVERMADCVEYLVGLIGPAHVALGSDFMFLEGSAYRWYYERQYMYPAGYPPPPWPFAQPEDLPKLTETLLRRGISETDVRAILGENFMRVADEVWR